MYKVYVVKMGDTFESIARDHNITLEELNRLNGNMISLIPGMQLIVPNNEKYNTYVVKSGDNLYAISVKYGVSLDSLISLNGLNKNDYIYPGQQILIPDSELEIYTTIENDTLQSVSSNLGISIEELLNNNDKIYLEEEQPIKYKRRK